ISSPWTRRRPAGSGDDPSMTRSSSGRSAGPARAAWRRQGADRARPDHPLVVAALSGIFVIAIAVTMLRSPQGVVVSADPGYAPTALPLLLVPSALAIAVALLLPAGSGGNAVTVHHRRRVVGESGGLIAL